MKWKFCLHSCASFSIPVCIQVFLSHFGYGIGTINPVNEQLFAQHSYYVLVYYWLCPRMFPRMCCGHLLVVSAIGVSYTICYFYVIHLHLNASQAARQGLKVFIILSALCVTTFDSCVVMVCDVVAIDVSLPAV